MKDVNILVEALPYIKKFHEKKILIKYGGHAMIDEDAMSSTVRDTVLLKYVGMEPLIVHGGGPEISRSMDKLGKEPKFIKGLRVTDEETIESIFDNCEDDMRRVKKDVQKQFLKKGA